MLEMDIRPPAPLEQRCSDLKCVMISPFASQASTVTSDPPRAEGVVHKWWLYMLHMCKGQNVQDKGWAWWRACLVK